MARAPKITGSVPKTVSAPRGGNANKDRSTLMRPPRLKPLNTRDYGKKSPVEPPSAGFGQTGLTGES